MTKKSDVFHIVLMHIWHGGENQAQMNALKIASAPHWQGIDLRIIRDVREYCVSLSTAYLSHARASAIAMPESAASRTTTLCPCVHHNDELGSTSLTLCVMAALSIRTYVVRVV